MCAVLARCALFLWLLGFISQCRFTVSAQHENLADRQPSTDALVQYNLAIDFDRAGSRADAINQYFKAISIHPSFAEAHQNVALLLEQENRIAESVHHTFMSVKHARTELFRGMCLNNMVSLLGRGQLFDLFRDISDDILNRLRFAVELRSTYNSLQLSELYNSIAIIFLGYGDQRAAFNSYLKALDHNENHTLALFGCGNIFFANRQYSEAQKYYTRCLTTLQGDDFINRAQILNNLVGSLNICVFLKFVLWLI